ncbi:MAG: hydantoinase/oxoprolinase N-terminal domain-containing protein, partial [Candidatus Binatia bacterium]
MSYCIGTDIGGTFTDCVVIDEKGAITVAKSPSVPKNFAEGLMDVLEEAAAKLGIRRDELSRNTRLFSHGTTIAANTLINRSGARIGLITTKGFEETLFLMRGSSLCQGLPIQAWYHCNQNERPFELIAMDRIIGINQRVDSRGEELVRLKEKEVKAAAEVLVEEKGCEAISVCYLWSTVNPIHEDRTREIIEKRYPKIFVSTSHEVIAVMGEYERASTTALNSYVRPAVEKYVNELDRRLKNEGLSVPFLLMQSNGGLLPALLTAKGAITILQSGPTGGVMAGKIIGELVGKDNTITTDMGGTSFDVSLVANG